MSKWCLPIFLPPVWPCMPGIFHLACRRTLPSVGLAHCRTLGAMKLRFVVPKMVAVILGMVLVCAALFAVVGAVVVKNLPDPIRWGIGAIHEATLTLEDEEQMLADAIAQLPAVNSAVVANTEGWRTKIKVVTRISPTEQGLRDISDKCTAHSIRTTLDDFQPILCTVTTEDGTLLGTYESGT